MQTLKVIPILRIVDVDKAKEFYVDFLGFRIRGEHRFDDTSPVYMFAERDGFELHLSEHHGDASPGSTVYVSITGIEALHAELIAKNYCYNRPGLERAFYGALCMEVFDPFGNRIRFNEELG